MPIGKTKISLLTQSAFLAFAICGVSSGFAQQANAPAVTSAPAQSENAKVDSSKTVEKDGVYEVGGPVKPPTIISFPEVEHPTPSIPFHHKKSADQICDISLIVDADGTPRDFQFADEAGSKCDDNARAAAKEYRFKPGTLDDKPVPVRVKLKIKFLNHNPQGTMQAIEISPDAKDSPAKATEKDGVYEVGGPVMPPAVLKSHIPKYTEAAKLARLEGDCVLSLVIDTQSRAENIQVTKSVGMGLDENAIEAVKKYRFRPATLDGKPVPVRIQLVVGFHIY